MNLAKHDPETEMEMDMTPMIDVVFLLIIFFMIITDLTQQDLEDLELPIALSATEDKPDPDEKRPIFNIKHTGEIIVRKEPLYAPETHDGFKDPMVDVKKKLAIIASNMPRKDDLPDDHLMIRGDRSVPFKYVQQVMQECAQKGIQIWKVQLAASMPNPE
ncbi:MAG: biopolymer transporter ExbD [Planctomycetota bacterium]|nr:biopolymer transporter ExbD [Planctomycetota bacterium]